jgi:hypothetical protein
MQNLLLMECLEPSRHLDQTIPNFPLTEDQLLLRVCHNPVVKVTPVCKLHHYAQTARFFVKKCFFVRYDVLVVNRRENSNFVDRIRFLFLREFTHSDLLGSDVLSIDLPTSERTV